MWIHPVRWFLFLGAVGLLADCYDLTLAPYTGDGGGQNADTGGTPAAGGTTAADGGVAGTGGGAPSGSGGSVNSGGTTSFTGRATSPTGGTTNSPGGATSSTGGSNGAGGSGGGGSTGALPAFTVNGNKLQDPSGKTIVLRGSSLIDIGSLYQYYGASAVGNRMDKIAAAGVQGHVVRLPVYPKIDYNGGYPVCSPLPYPVGSGPTASCTPTTPMTADDYYTKVLKPAVDYATSKNLYVIIAHHQIDDASKGTSSADAKTFWTDIAPKFASHSNVLFEVFSEPIDSGVAWATLKPVVQGWIDTIRASAPNNIIIVPSMSYSQHPGDASSDPPTGGNLMYTAHIYPGNWNAAFHSQVTTAVAKAPVFITEWGYTYLSSPPDTSLRVDQTTSSTWGTDLRTFIDGSGASWTAWVTDNAWTPSMFTNSSLTTLTDFGNLTKIWLADKATSDWVR